MILEMIFISVLVALAWIGVMALVLLCVICRTPSKGLHKGYSILNTGEVDVSIRCGDQEPMLLRAGHWIHSDQS
jgi:hypothetical protein